MQPLTSIAPRPPVLFVGDAVATTGFARVMHSLCEALKSRYEIHHLAINYQGDPHDLGWRIYPAKLGGDAHGVNRLLPLTASIRPRLVFLLNDIWILAEYMERLRALPDRPKVVMYCPVDAGPIEAAVVERLEGVDRFVVYTQFAKREIDAALARLRKCRPDFCFPEVEVIAHGVDTALFHPNEPDAVGAFASAGRRRAIRSILGEDMGEETPFIVLNANRNQPRKRIDITIKGFALFAAGKPANVKLHLHMGVQDAGWNVVQLAQRYGIEERIILTTDGDNLPSVPIAQLNSIYNAAAVGINTSIGEGWGLVSFEHAATGAAQIVPRHSACQELWESSALLLDPVMSVTTESLLTEGYFVSPEGVAQALEMLYRDRELLGTLSKAAYRTATQDRYQWSNIGEIWHGLFQELMATSQALPPRHPAQQTLARRA